MRVPVNIVLDIPHDRFKVVQHKLKETFLSLKLTYGVTIRTDEDDRLLEKNNKCPHCHEWKAGDVMERFLPDDTPIFSCGFCCVKMACLINGVD